MRLRAIFPFSLPLALSIFRCFAEYLFFLSFFLFFKKKNKTKDVGPLFSVNMTYGQMDKNIQWINVSVPATMLECPDIFAIGSKTMVLGSLFQVQCRAWCLEDIDGWMDPSMDR